VCVYYYKQISRQQIADLLYVQVSTVRRIIAPMTQPETLLPKNIGMEPEECWDWQKNLVI